MDKEYLEMKKMTYSQLVNYLQTKYGVPQGSYWLTPSCRTKNNKIMRGKEGLYCHHVREDLSNCLCNSSLAVTVPFEWHQDNNLVYCNFLEHSLLHLKIAEWIDKEKPSNYSPTSGLGYFGNISAFTSDMLKGYKFSMPFYALVQKQMKPYREEIIEVFKEAGNYKYDGHYIDWYGMLGLKD